MLANVLDRVAVLGVRPLDPDTIPDGVNPNVPVVILDGSEQMVFPSRNAPPERLAKSCRLERTNAGSPSVVTKRGPPAER